MYFRGRSEIWASWISCCELLERAQTWAISALVVKIFQSSFKRGASALGPLLPRITQSDMAGARLSIGRTPLRRRSLFKIEILVNPVV
jgi:hypothetical protein